MLPRHAFAAGVASVAIAACSLTNLNGFSGGADSDAGTTIDSGSDVATESGIDPTIDSGADAATDSGNDAPACSCAGLVSAYRFSDAATLGKDFFGKNDMLTVHGTPKQAAATPPGLAGKSIELDGASTVCIDSGFSFDSTADHTVCWWSRPSALADSTNQFAQQCSYDTWTTTAGADYDWRINNCNGGTAVSFVVPAVYEIGKWTQICQTYSSASKTRTVVINGSRKSSVTDAVPILEPPAQPWCIGSYGTGGYWTGLIYLPLWFDRALSDAEMAKISSTACCLP
jgi:hypothetical protein